MVTRSQLKKVYVYAPYERIDKFLPSLNACMQKYSINTPERIRMFLAQIGHESGQLRFVEENLNYSASALRKVFGKYFKDIEFANGYARNPEKIANRTYANRGGNGDEASGDGWKYRGRGLIQVTLKDNYIEISKAFGVSFVTAPGLLSEPEYAVESACWWWKNHGLNELADTKDIRKCTRRINGGYKGLDDRTKLYELAKKYIV